MSWGKLTGLLLALAFLGLLGFGLSRDPRIIPSPLVGQPAPDFRLPSLEGPDTVALADLTGKVVVVNFWASWCLSCIQEHPALVRAWERFKDQDVEMIGIVYQDTPENARRYLRRYGGGWTQLIDPQSRAAIDFGVYGVPETFFLDRTGRIAHKHIGPVNDELLYQQIHALLQSQPETPTPVGEGEEKG